METNSLDFKTRTRNRSIDLGGSLKSAAMLWNPQLNISSHHCLLGEILTILPSIKDFQTSGTLIISKGYVPFGFGDRESVFVPFNNGLRVPSHMTSHPDSEARRYCAILQLCCEPRFFVLITLERFLHIREIELDERTKNEIFKVER